MKRLAVVVLSLISLSAWAQDWPKQTVVVENKPGASGNVAAPEVQARLAQLGLDWKGNTSGQFAAFLREEVQKWARAVKDSGAKAD